MSKAKTLQTMAARDVQLVLTYGGNGASYSLSDGAPVPAKVGKELTRETVGNSGWTQDDLFVVPNDDGLFPGMSQTWSVIQ
jgi:hypothetical protein